MACCHCIAAAHHYGLLSHEKLPHFLSASFDTRFFVQHVHNELRGLRCIMPTGTFEHVDLRMPPVRS
jgi:hypothetical protein